MAELATAQHVQYIKSLAISCHFLLILLSSCHIIFFQVYHCLRALAIINEVYGSKDELWQATISIGNKIIDKGT